MAQKSQAYLRQVVWTQCLSYSSRILPLREWIIYPSKSYQMELKRYLSLLLSNPNVFLWTECIIHRGLARRGRDCVYLSATLSVRCSTFPCSCCSTSHVRSGWQIPHLSNTPSIKSPQTWTRFRCMQCVTVCGFCEIWRSVSSTMALDKAWVLARLLVMQDHSEGSVSLSLRFIPSWSCSKDLIPLLISPF